MFVVSASTITKHYNQLNQMGVYHHNSEHGFNRPAYSDAETQVMRYIEEEALQAGLLTRWDAVGNLMVETAGDHTSWVETGSHVDTVTGGGNYDGLAGVVAGLEVLIATHKSKMSLKHGLRLRVWRGEESSAFGTASLGSWAAFGLLSPEVLKQAHQGLTLEEAMKQQGAKPECVKQSKTTIPQMEVDGIKAHIELHIEQGNMLESQACDVGIVTGIRGSIRSWVRLRGVFDHSGATPMGSEYRRDANLAMAHMMVKLDELLHQFNEGEAKVVQTFGVINNHGNHNQRFPLIHENAVSKVSGFAYFSFEIRSCDDDVAQSYYQLSKALIEEVSNSFQVDTEVELISESTGIPALDDDIQQATVKACKQQNRTYTHLASGAWHDVAVLSHQTHSSGNLVPTGMIFIPCLAGISHAADEYASPKQIAVGASILGAVMTDL